MLFREPPPPHLVPSWRKAAYSESSPDWSERFRRPRRSNVARLGDTLAGRLLTIDVMTMVFRTIEIRPDPECPACGTRSITELIDYDEFCAGAATANERGRAITEIQPAQLAERLQDGRARQIGSSMCESI